MPARNLAVLVTGVSIALGAAACGTDADTGAVPAAAATSAPSPPGAVSTTSAPTAATSACPVTEADLKGAVKEKTDNGVSSESKFARIVCYKNWAVATIPEDSKSDEAYAVFKYDSAWSLVSGGATGDICQGIPGGVPADVVKRFRSAHYGACR